jgi:hypothetical protein
VNVITRSWVAPRYWRISATPSRGPEFGLENQQSRVDFMQVVLGTFVLGLDGSPESAVECAPARSSMNGENRTETRPEWMYDVAREFQVAAGEQLDLMERARVRSGCQTPRSDGLRLVSNLLRRIPAPANADETRTLAELLA